MKKLIVVVIALQVSGCALMKEAHERVQGTYESNREAERKAAAEEEERIAHQYDNWTEDQVMAEYGAPSKIENAGSFKIYYYRKDRGASSRGSGFANQYGAVSKSRYKNHFEETTFFFKEGKVSRYEYHRQ